MTTTLSTAADNSSGSVAFKGTDLITLKTTGPELLGVPKAPTPTAGANTTQVATTAFVTSAINAMQSGNTSPSNTTPYPDAAVGAAGNSILFARGDHVHPQFTTPSNSVPLPDAVSGTAGGSTNYARADHVHPSVASSLQPSNTTPLADSTSPSAGSSNNYSRGDHVHPQFATAASNIPALPTVSGSSGSSSAYARGDHAHPAGAQSLAANGYVTLPGGLILQWGFSTFSASGSSVSFPVSFPSAVYSVTATSETTGTPDAIAIYNKSTGGFTGKTAGNLGCSWMATGR